MPRRSTNDAPLTEYLDELIEKLRQQAPAAVEHHDTKAIHQSRVITRRLTAAIKVLKPILLKSHRRAFTATLGKLRSRLGTLRDLDVMIDQLSRIRAARHQPAIAWVTGHLHNQRDHRRAKTIEKVDAAKVLAKLDAWDGIRQEMSRGQPAINALLAESLHLQLDAFIEHANGVSPSRSLRYSEEPDSPGVDPTHQRNSEPGVAASDDVAPKPMHDPHDMRIAGKSLRYSLEMAVANGHRLPASITRSFKKMQDALGDWHDFVVLAECLITLPLRERLALHDAPLGADVLNLARTLLSRASRSLDRFSVIWKDSGEEITRTIRQTFPLTRPVDQGLFTAPKMDLDPPRLTEAPVDPVPPASAPTETSAA